MSANTLTVLNTLFATAGFIITMLGIGVGILRGANWASKEKV